MNSISLGAFKFEFLYMLILKNPRGKNLLGKMTTDILRFIIIYEHVLNY